MRLLVSELYIYQNARCNDKKIKIRVTMWNMINKEYARRHKYCPASVLCRKRKSAPQKLLNVVLSYYMQRSSKY